MKDYSELKRLAEKFPDYDWDSNHNPFFNGPSGESLGGDPKGFYCVYGKPFEIDGETYDGVTLIESCPADQAKFICDAKASVLELIAEVDQAKLICRISCNYDRYKTVLDERDNLKAEVERQAEEIVELKDGNGGLRWAIGEMKGQHKNLHRSLCARFGYIHDENNWWRDDVSLEEHIAKQLQEALAGQMHLTSERDLLKSELESLKKDAARYRWLRDSSNFGKKSDPMVISGYPDDISMLVCVQLDIEIDNRIERDSK